MLRRAATRLAQQHRILCSLPRTQLPSVVPPRSPIFQAQRRTAMTGSESNKRQRTDSESKDDWKTQPPYAPEDPKKPKKALFKGSCHCHKVTFEIYVDKPKGSHCCHCDTCQKLHGSAMHWSVVIPKNEVLFTCSPDKISFYRTEDQKTEHILPCKLSCAHCHSPVADEGRNMMLMYPSTWDFEKFEDRQAFLPDKHIFYSQRAIDVQDGMPKWDKMQDESAQLDEEHHHGQKGIVGEGSKVSHRRGC